MLTLHASAGADHLGRGSPFHSLAARRFASMGNEKASEIGETAKAVAEIVKAVPVYQDAVKPAAQEV